MPSVNPGYLSRLWDGIEEDNVASAATAMAGAGAAPPVASHSRVPVEEDSDSVHSEVDSDDDIESSDDSDEEDWRALRRNVKSRAPPPVPVPRSSNKASAAASTPAAASRGPPRPQANSVRPPPIPPKPAASAAAPARDAPKAANSNPPAPTASTASPPAATRSQAKLSLAYEPPPYEVSPVPPGEDILPVATGNVKPVDELLAGVFELTSYKEYVRPKELPSMGGSEEDEEDGKEVEEIFSSTSISYNVSSSQR